uniref:C2H2-type domain-containing protein n=1 Tax=Stomoxys calcitrans TaxID=35570 RepID=A0A1I8PAV7_STOCA
MEIVMKVKCSPTPVAGTSSAHPSIQIVEPHRQLQQRNGTGGYNKTNTPPQQIATSYTNNECPLSAASCAECIVGYCCNLQTCCLPPTTTLQTPPPLLPLPAGNYNTNATAPMAAEDQPEFVSIDDEKVKQYLMKFGQQHLMKQRKSYQNEAKVTHVVAAASKGEQYSRPIVYEIIELDDENEREKLKQIKEQAELNLAAKSRTNPGIDLNFANRHAKSLNISLIPKPSETPPTSQPCQTTATVTQNQTKKSKSLPSNHRIIAEINLLDDSSDDELSVENESIEDVEDDDDDDGETLPLAAVSCELDCDDDEDDNSNSLLVERSLVHRGSNLQVLNRSKHFAKISNEFANDHLLARWEEYEGQRERVFFECFLCGKKVQSSYNLRRHMMIHTGERPFACDLCDRRFREFSDLKKHRRRHAAEPNFICMVCREMPPVENDSTRCLKCCMQSKNVVLMAAMKRGEEEQDGDQIPEESSITTLSSTPPSPVTTTSASTVATTTLFSTSSNAKSSTTIPTKKFKENVDRMQQHSASVANTEDTHRLLENIPAVHRPGHNQLGMITRKEFACPLCNRAFGTRHNLKRHYMIHTGEKPFSCSKCRKPFREYSTLKKHMVTHQRDRWYKCMQCPMKFRDFLKYTEHKDSHPHLDYDEKETTNDAEASRSFRKTHSKYNSSDSYMDSNEDDSISDACLECCECSQQFNDIDAYNEHLKEHNNSCTEIYQCCYCKDHFEHRIELEKHMAKHKPDSDSDEYIID